MPVPVVAWWIIGGVVGLLFGAAAFSWKSEVPKLKGKTLAVFGIRSAGKTVLLKYLTTGILACDYTPSILAESTRSRQFKLKDIEINLEESTDVPGARENYEQWKTLFDKADIVICLINCKVILKSEKNLNSNEKLQIHSIREYLNAIQQWRGNPNKQYFVVGTHCDLIPDFNESTFVSYTTKFSEAEIVRMKAAGMIPLIGSLVDESRADKLIYNIFKHLKG